MSKFLKSLVIAFSISLMAGYSFATLRSTDNLRRYETNLDILADKSGNLHQLIEEIQGFDVIKATCEGSGSVILDSTVLENDTIIFVTVLSSANNVQASSTTLAKAIIDGSEGGSVILKSKVLGTMGNNISLNFVQNASTNTVFTINGSTQKVNAGTLVVYTTGYAIDVWLSTTGIYSFMASTTAGTFASASDVCSAIESDAGANDLVSCQTNTSTRTVVALSGILLKNGEGSVLVPNTISGSYFTAGNGKITVGTNAPVSKYDGLVIYLYKRPITQ